MARRVFLAISKGLYAYANVAADLGIAALQGSINAVATVKWCIFGCKKTYRKKIFSWTGFRKNWNLFKVEAKLYILGDAAGQASASASAAGAGKVKINANVVKAIGEGCRQETGREYDKRRLHL